MTKTKTQTVQEKQEAQILKKLHAQIAVYSGSRVGGVRALRSMTLDLFERYTIVCDCCKREIWKDGHAEACSILKKYRKVFNLSGPCPCDNCGGE